MSLPIGTLLLVASVLTSGTSSGEEERHRATELNMHGPTVRGWQSAKNCSYPQEIILQLQCTATVQRIQILTHQYLISEKIELWAGDLLLTEDSDEACDLETSPGGTNFEYLGFITLSDNQNTGFKSRELKSVTVPSCTAKYLKLRLHANHKNELNIYNQVGLIAINVLGQQLVPVPDSLLSMKCNLEQNGESNNNGHEEKELTSVPVKTDTYNNNPLLLVNNPEYTSPYDDLAFEMYVDPDVAKIIRAMEVKKQHAVICERFEYARKLKLAMEDLRRAGERLSKYELEKRQAIHLEDYDRAKLKKVQMDQYREMVYQFLEVDDLLEINGALEKNDECIEISSGGKRPELPTPPRLLQVPQEPSSSSRDGAISPNHVAPPAMHQSPVSPLHNQQSKSPTAALNSHSKTTPNTSPTNQQQANIRSSQRRRNKCTGQTPARTSYEAYEERTIPALRHCHSNSARECQTDPEVPNRSKLTEREKKQAALPIAVFGIEIVERFYSKQYSDKEEGLRMLQEELRSYTSGEVPAEHKHPPNKTARAAIFLLHRALRDKVYSVYSLAAETIRLFFVEFIPARVSPAEVARSVDRLLPELLSKSGDPTPRIHNMAVHTVLSMADCQEVRELHIIPVHLSRPLTSSTHPRLALSRLEMVEQLILNHGISTDKQSGLTCRVLAEFGSSGLHHPAEPVRKVAERILTLVYKVNPRLVRKQLPPDDDITRRNLLYRQLFHEFDRIDMLRKKAILEKNRQQQEHLDAQQRVTMSQNVNKSPGHQTGSSSSSASAITSPSDISQPDASEDKMCIFCFVRAESFTEEGLNIHYWKTCPMLTRCSYCKQVVEISCLSQHMIEECDSKDSYRRCDRCTEAILITEIEEHITMAACIPAEPLMKGNHCPLCHKNIPPWEDGWRQHLIAEPCPNHPRKKYIKNRSKSPSETRDKQLSTTAERKL